jgi:hypothetical protein
LDATDSSLHTAGLCGSLATCLRILDDPDVGQEFANLIDGMARQSFQNILQTGKRIDLMTAATSY